MPRNYQRKTQRQSWLEENMLGAVTDVLNGKMGYLKASRIYSVPQSTLEDRVRRARQENLSPTEAAKKRLGRYKPVFTMEQERKLVDYILSMKNGLFDLTLNEVRRLAYELAVRNKINNNFNKEKKMAGKDWLYGFFKRHKTVLSLRNPEEASIARAMGFNHQTVNKFLDLLDSLLKKYPEMEAPPKDS